MNHPFPDTVEPWPIDRLIPYGRNARTHSDVQVAQIAASIVEFGWTNPVLADSQGNVIAGHGRLAAAKSLGLDTVPVVILDHLTEAQRRAYILADNKLALNAGWDDETLSAELHALNAEGYDLDLIGFSEEELDALMAPLDDEGDGDGEAGEDEIPEPPADPVTRPGDLWILGRHRLLCGDSTSATDVERLLAGAVPHLMTTDPPYGVEYDPTWRNEAGVSSTTRTGKVANDDRADWSEAWALFPGEVAYVWHAAIYAKVVADSLEANDFKIRAQIIWSKNRFVLGRGDYHWQHEPCWYAVRKNGTGHWQGARDQATVWAIGNNGDEDEATVHGTQKPVECMRRPILNNSAEGDGVYEPFAGSGTTVIAAETTGRICFAMELNPAYADVIVGRWQKLTGQKAVLDGDGRSFEEVAAGKAINAG
ncbi:site-specific DNA-methyltransferase [Magnetospirillum gryphiswaldense]|nr:site-specific DNA-methyltransferase [Magnetospirillum gryphiswaldense]